METAGSRYSDRNSSTIVNLDHEDLGFAFDNPTFSDRVLKLVTEHENGSVGVVKEVHVNAAILSARSRFFEKLFTNGMLETNQYEAALTIQPNEEDTVMQLLEYIYKNSVETTEARDFRELLLIADKYLVHSCVSYCINELLTLPMELEDALVYLHMPRTLSPTEEIMSLPFPTIDGLLTLSEASDKLQGSSMETAGSRYSDQDSSSIVNLDQEDFGFAFNNPTFSDRVLKLLIEHEDGSVGVIKEVHVNAAILSARSHFFKKIMETNKSEAALAIQPNEEDTVMRLLEYIYKNSVASTETQDFLELLLIADKYLVHSCVSYCINELLTLPMELEDALEYLHLPWTLLMAIAVKPLILASQRVIASHYGDLNENPTEEIMSLPFLAIEAIFSSDDLLTLNEDSVYDALVAWTEMHFSDFEEKQEIMRSLSSCIRFPFISPSKLEDILIAGDLQSDVATRLVMEALTFRTASLSRKRSLAVDQRFVERTYKYKMVTLVEFDLPLDQTIVYLNLKRSECAKLYPDGKIYTEGFSLWGHRFHISVRSDMDGIGLFLEAVRVAKSEMINYEFSARSDIGQQFIVKYIGSSMTSQGDSYGCMDLLGLPWVTFLSEDSEYFIDDVLYLRVDVTVYP